MTVPVVRLLALLVPRAVRAAAAVAEPVPPALIATQHPVTPLAATDPAVPPVEPVRSTPLIVPPVIATALAFCVAMVPRPKAVKMPGTVVAPVPPWAMASGVVKVKLLRLVAPAESAPLSVVAPLTPKVPVTAVFPKPLAPAESVPFSHMAAGDHRRCTANRYCHRLAATWETGEVGSGITSPGEQTVAD